MGEKNGAEDFSGSEKQVTAQLASMALGTEMTVSSTLSRRTKASANPEESWTAVPRWRVAEGERQRLESRQPDLIVAERLGQGGMGTVDSATQTSLRREVAVKRLRVARESADNRDALLREACLTGSLEHPNIIPIHAVGKSDADGPIVVMKRIYGQPWQDILAQDRERSIEERLDRHLKIFIQVGQAIEFAHSRGVIHRDIKPENVMVGAYGEVVLVDWGVAATLSGLQDGRETGIAGTPAYMPPEQAAGAAEHIGPHSDVYLLGAVLYQIVSGHPPRHDTTIAAALLDALKLPIPAVPPPCPAELAGIIAKACAYAPSDRYDSVATLIHEVERFVHRRPLGRLLDAASLALARLKDVVLPDDPQRHRETYQQAVNAFAEVRFAHAQASAGWPDDDHAEGLLADALRTMAQLEVAFGHPDAAQTLLVELGASDPELTEAVDDLRRTKEADAAELAGRRRDDDLDAGRPIRIIFATSLCVVAVGIVVFISATSESFQVSRGQLFGIAVGFAAIVVVFFGVTRQRLLATRVDRQMVFTVLLFTGVIVVHRGAAWVNEVSIPWVMTTELLILATLFALLAPFHRHATVSALITLLALGASIVDPAWALPLYSAVSPICIGVMAYGWRSVPRGPQAATTARPPIRRETQVGP